MPIPNTDTPISSANMDVITEGLTSIKSAMAAQLVNLTPEERTKVSNLGDKRYPYGQRSVTVHGVNNPMVVPPFRPLDKATDSLTLYDQFNLIIPQFIQLVEMALEAQQIPGHNVYEFTRMLYDQAKQASTAGVPGTDSIVEDIAPLFEGQGNFNEPPAPPVE